MEIELKSKNTSSECYPTTSYETSFEHSFAAKQNVEANTPCPTDPTSEAAALKAAWDHFDGVASSYCGNGKCADNHVCNDTITGRSAKLTGRRRSFVPAAPETPNSRGTLECFVTIEMSATISCACAKK